MRFTACLVAVLVAVLVVVPAAQASHTMGHRYLVWGRIVDANGMPMQNQDVTLKILSQGSSLASIVTRTDCLGDFESWDGRRGSDPLNGGAIEEQTTHDPPYIAFHFHDPDLSDRLKVQVTLGNDTWTENFHSRERQTIVRHQVSVVGAAACGGYDEFASSFAFRIGVLNDDEWKTGEVQPRRRQVSVTLGTANLNGTTDYNGHYLAMFSNATLAGGESLHVTATDLGDRSFPIDAEAMKYRFAGTAVRLGADAGEVLDDLKNFGIVLLVAALLVGAWLGGRHLKARMEERRLRQTSTRRRFRKQQPPPP